MLPFLNELHRNENYEAPSLSLLIYSTLPVTQHFSSIIIFVCLFIHLYTAYLRPTHLLLLLSLVCMPSVLRAPPLSPSPVLLVVMLYLLSPALRTLTAATTSDSIWALAAILFLTNAVLANYTLPNSIKEIKEHPSLKFPAPLSLSAAISASTVLASRLEAAEQVFAFMLFSVVWFGLFPGWRRELPAKGQILLGVSLMLAATYMLGRISSSSMWIYLLSFFGLTFGAPLGLMNVMKHKNEIRGPWDEAVPKMEGRSVNWQN
ncbi:GPI2-domain-containing protein [Atractiella rhizophila]|nr:GPI2-domain-containing protein [Atractiella rhizophila]